MGRRAGRRGAAVRFLDDLGRAFGDALRAAHATAQSGVLRDTPSSAPPTSSASPASPRASSAAPRSTGSTTPTRARLLEVNTAYRERHGFPLVIAVRGHTVEGLIVFGASRVDHDTDAELATGVEQVALIAAARVADRVRP